MVPPVVVITPPPSPKGSPSKMMATKSPKKRKSKKSPTVVAATTSPKKRKSKKSRSPAKIIMTPRSPGGTIIAAPSGYFLYAAEYRAKSGKGVRVADIGAGWRSLSDSEKARWNKESKIFRARRRAAIDRGGEIDIVRIRKPRVSKNPKKSPKPKNSGSPRKVRAKSSYNKYFSSEYSRDEDFKSNVARISGNWKMMSEEEKKAWA